MKKAAVIYWSGTGNTEAMAIAVAEGMKGAGAEVSLLSADAVSAADLAGLDAVALGCPAMGSEVLEEDVFEPMFSSCKKQFVGKSAALFGSYGWGDGEWMRTWEQDCRGANISLACESVICCETPGDIELEACRELGRELVK